LLKLVL